MRTRDLQLYRYRRLRYDLPELAQITLRFPAKRQADDFITGKPIDDVVERAIEENLSVIDDYDPVAQLRDVLHVMTREQGDDAMLGIVDSQKFAHPFLTNNIETCTNCGSPLRAYPKNGR